MSRLNQLRKLLQDYNICYNGYAVNGEEIIDRYLWFLFRSYNKKKHNVSIAMNNGDVFFDIASIVFAAIAALLANTDNEELGLHQLGKGSLVYYEGDDIKNGRELYLYKGNEMLQVSDLPPTEYAILEKNSKDRYTRKIPKQQWYKIKPYLNNGEKAFTTGGRLKSKTEKRYNNIASLTGASFSKTAEMLCNTVVIVASKQTADDILNNVTIKDRHTKEEYPLLDVITASYFTEKGEDRYRGNVEKSEPVLKITSKLSVARDLVYNPDENEVLGLFVLEKDGSNQSRTELDELINRRSLGFVFLSFMMDSSIAFDLLKEYEEANVFACTKEYIFENTSKYRTVSDNKYALIFDKRIQTIENQETNAIVLESGIKQGEYSTLKKSLKLLKNNNLTSDNIEAFVIQAWALLNLLITAPFTSTELDEYLKLNTTTASIISISSRFEILNGYSQNWTGLLKEQATLVINGLEDLYENFNCTSPKRDYLYEQLTHAPRSRRIAVIIPKAFYESVIRYGCNQLSDNIVFVTPNRFDNSCIFDQIYTLGNYRGKRFDFFKSISAQKIDALIYDFERDEFKRRMYWAKQDEKILNSRIDLQDHFEVEDFDGDNIQNEELSDIDDILLDESEYIDIDVLKSQSSFSDRVSNQIVSVIGSGLFVDGDFIWFSKNYKATVFDLVSEKVSIVPVEDIQPGNILIFTRRSSLTKDIVDEILEKLIEEGRVNSVLEESYQKVQHWKSVLRDYMSNKEITYEELSKELSRYGEVKHFATVRTWIHPFSHIVGPMDVDSYKQIAMLTRDKQMLKDPADYCKASKVIRDERRLILKTISNAIVKRLGGEATSEDSLFNAVYDNIDELSLQKQIETVSLFESEESAPMGIVNRPISI